MTTKMSKIFTGVVLTPINFRELNYCLFCGKECKIKYGGTCKECKKLNYKHCKICTIVLRKGWYDFYTYDTTEDKRDYGINFKPNKRKIREFVEKEYIDNIGSEDLCKGCIEWQNRMQDVCPKCDNDFSNNEEHYKQYGNLCYDCVAPRIMI